MFKKRKYIRVDIDIDIDYRYIHTCISFSKKKALISLLSYRRGDALYDRTNCVAPLSSSPGVDQESRVTFQKTVLLTSAVDQGHQIKASVKENNESGAIFDLVLMLKQKTFTRSEIDQLTEILHSKTVESSTGDLLRSSGFGFQQTFLEEDVATPIELAKAFMGNRSSKVCPSASLSTGFARALKRRNSVLDDEDGSLGSIRRLRQKFNPLTTRNRSLLIAKTRFSSRGTQNMPGSSRKVVPSQSKVTARKIFHQLKKFAPNKKQLESKDLAEMDHSSDRRETMFEPTMVDSKAVPLTEEKTAPVEVKQETTNSLAIHASYATETVLKPADSINSGWGKVQKPEDTEGRPELQPTSASTKAYPECSPASFWDLPDMDVTSVPSSTTQSTAASYESTPATVATRPSLFGGECKMNPPHSPPPSPSLPNYFDYRFVFVNGVIISREEFDAVAAKLRSEDSFYDESDLFCEYTMPGDPPPFAF